MSVKPVTCPGCKSTDVKSTPIEAQPDSLGRQNHRLTCTRCGYVFDRRLLVKRTRGTRY